MVEDVVGRRLLALRRAPALAHADEDARIATAADVEDLVGELALLRAQVDDQRRDEARVERVGQAAEQLLGEPRLRDRSDRVDLDVVLRALDREHVHEANQAHLRGAVVRLAEVAEDARARRRYHDPAVAVLLHRGERGLGDEERALQVHVDDRLEVLGLELGEALVAQDPGVVHEDVDPAEVVERGLDDRLAAFGRGDRVVVGCGLAAGLDDLLHGRVGHAAAAAAAVGRAAEVVHDDGRAAARELEGVGLAEAAARAGDHGHAAVETDLAHGGVSWGV